MCKIMFIVNNDENSNVSNLLQVNQSLFKNEKDGNAIMIEKENSKAKVELYETTIEALEVLMNESKNKGVYGIHTRTATSGLINEKNNHFWEDTGFIFGHNGFVPALDKMSSEKCDSKLFFESLMRDIKGVIKKRKKKGRQGITPYRVLKLIKDNVERFDFVGVAILYDTRSRIVYLIGTRNIDIVSDSKNFLAFCSFDPHVNFTRIKRYKGFSFFQENTPLGLDKTELGKGFYAYSIEKGSIINEIEIETSFGFNSYSSYSGYLDDQIERKKERDNFLRQEYQEQARYFNDL